MSDSHPHVQVIVHARWSVMPAVGTSPDAVWDRLPSYVTRYAHTLGVVVHAVGGAADRLHFFFDLPADRSLDSVNDELQQAAFRFLRDTLGQPDFGWNPVFAAQSVSIEECESRRAVIDAIREDGHSALGRAEAILGAQAAGTSDEAPPEEDEVPEWLRSVLPGADTHTE